MSTRQGLTLSYVMSLVGGLIVLVFSLINAVWFGSGAPNWGGFGGYMSGAMDGYHNFMGNYASSNNFFVAISIVSLVCGVIVLMSCICAKASPRRTRHLGNSYRGVFRS